MTISFNDIPSNLRVPFVYVEFDSSRAVQGASIQPYKNLVLGQKTTGAATAEVPILITDKDQAANQFGPGSMLALMAEALFNANNFTETWFMPLDDAGAAVDASGTITISGVATENGAIKLYIAGRAVTVGVVSADTATEIADAIVATITADTSLPVTASNVAGVVTCTAKNGGEFGNEIDLRVNYYDGEETVSGVGVVIVAMAGGANNPSIATALAALGDEHYNIIANPYIDAVNLVLLENDLADRWGPLRMIEGLAFSASKNTHSGLSSLGNSRNSKHLSIINAHGSPNTAAEWAASVAGVVSKYGQQDPARPLQTLQLPKIMPPKSTDRFNLSENNILLYDGISTHSVDSGGSVRIQRLITTYKQNAAGADDISYLDVNTPLTLGYLRFDFRNYLLRKYPRHKLAGDNANFGAGQPVLTPKTGKAEAIAVFRSWEDKGLVENIDQFKNDLIVERNASDPNRLDFFLPPDLVNQFRVGGVQIGFLL